MPAIRAPGEPMGKWTYRLSVFGPLGGRLGPTGTSSYVVAAGGVVSTSSTTRPVVRQARPPGRPVVSTSSTTRRARGLDGLDHPVRGLDNLDHPRVCGLAKLDHPAAPWSRRAR